MKAHLVAAALCVLVMAPGMALAQAAGGEPALTKPGSMRITARPPDEDKWDAQRSANGMQRTFKCKPLACAEPQTVTFVFTKSPTRNPDPEALEKFAKVDLPKSIRAAGAAREVMSDGTEKIETLMSKTATLKGYPAVINESKITRGQTPSFVQTAIIFAGPLMIRMQSTSPNEQLAQQALEQFLEVMKIEEGPPAPPAPPPAQRPQPGARSL